MTSKSFTSKLEEKAKILITDLNFQTPSFSSSNHIKQDIALTLEQITKLRKNHKNQMKSLLRSECYIGTQNKQERAEEYFKGIPIIDKCDSRLLSLESERRRLKSFYEEKMSGMFFRLLGLVQSHHYTFIESTLRPNPHLISKPLKSG